MGHISNLRKAPKESYDLKKKQGSRKSMELEEVRRPSHACLGVTYNHTLLLLYLLNIGSWRMIILRKSPRNENSNTTKG